MGVQGNRVQLTRTSSLGGCRAAPAPPTLDVDALLDALRLTARWGSRRSAEAVRLNADEDGRGVIAGDDDQKNEQASIRRGDSSK